MSSFRLEDCACPGCDGVSWREVLHSRAQLSRLDHTFRFVRCSDCGLVYINPRVAPQDIGVFYGDGYLPHVGARAWGRFEHLVGVWQKQLDRRRVRLVRSVVRLGPDSSVLDVGCGRPSFLRTLREATTARAVGIDVTDAGWREESWPGLELHEGTVASLEPGRGFDAVTMWHALEHEPRPRETLERLRAWSHKGAALVVEVPDFDSVGRRLQGGDWGGLHTPRHYSLFTAQSLRTLLEKCGWTVQVMRRRGTLDPFVLWWLGRPAMHAGSPEGRFLRFAATKAASWPIWGRPGADGWGVLTAVARR